MLISKSPVFDDIIKNITPNEIVICEDRDPSWINHHITKSYILYKNRFCKLLVREETVYSNSVNCYYVKKQYILGFYFFT